ncbi:MAG: hypothetical protein M1820_010479 [Bogoriella megaspora]|nr:MAG: hypothetical protein M1820_010479 [Bogoriella megaspora]
MSVVDPALALALNKGAGEADIGTASDPRITRIANINKGSPEEESFWGTVKAGAGTAFEITKKYGLSILKDILNSSTESAFDQSSTAIEDHLEGLSERAVMGEAALQALANGNALASEEGFFDLFKKTVQTIGPQVISLAPTVLKDVAPIVGSLLSNV